MHGAESAELAPIYIDATYRPTPAGHAAANGLHPLPEAEYRRAVSRTLRRQRLAAYRHAAFNAWRFPAPMLAQLAAVTLQNKVRALWERAGTRDE
jgi:hypothetical protein